MKKKTIKWILGIIGLIFLGALGNALWNIIEPVGNWFLNIIFKITTLGLSSLDDAFYRAVAKGLHEESSLEILGIIMLIICIYVGGELGKILAEYSARHPTKKRKGMSSDEYDKYLKKLNLASWRINYIRAIIFLIFVSFIVFRQSTIVKRNRAITHFRQSFAAAKYAMNEEEEELILLKFSVIKNKQDYLNILNTLQEKLVKKQQELEKEQQSLEIKRQEAEK